MARDPKTDAEWREAVLCAHALRALHDVKLYGLLEGGPKINVARCDELIDRGKERGLYFSQTEVMDAAVAFAGKTP